MNYKFWIGYDFALAAINTYAYFFMGRHWYSGVAAIACFACGLMVRMRQSRRRYIKCGVFHR